MRSQFSDEIDDGTFSRKHTKKMKRMAKNGHGNVVNFPEVNDQRQLRSPPLTGKTPKQKLYLNLLRESSQVIAIGCAGTGKTFIPTAYAADQLKNKKITKIVLTRPNEAAGRSLGFFPGTLMEKMAPWSVPFVEVLKSRMGHGAFECALKNEQIEIVPFETMRGRTFSDAFVIVDEAQNCSIAQLKMLVTRIGENSQLVINGDIKQTDIKGSGLARLIAISKQASIDVPLVEFTSEDIVRSDIVKNWIIAFDKFGE